MPRDIRNLNEALEAIEEISMQSDQGSVVKVSDVRRLLTERREVLAKEIEERIENRIPYRMKPERARRLAMRDEELVKAHSPGRPLEPTRSIPAGPPASEGVKS